MVVAESLFLNLYLSSIEHVRPVVVSLWNTNREGGKVPKHILDEILPVFAYPR